MKLNLGRIFLLLFLPFLLNASHYWEVKVSKTDLVVGEATLLSYTCYFDGEAYGTSIDMLLPKKDDDYSIKVYKESENIINDKRQNHFQYVIFAKRAIDINISLKAEFRKTSREQVENAVIGRDNVEYYQFEKTEDTLPYIILHVKDISAKLVGDFSLHVSTDKENLTSYEPLHVSITLEGVGNLQNYKPLELNISNADIFKEKVKRNYHLSPDGFRGSVTQKFAVVSDKNFSITPFLLEAYNPKNAKSYYLQSKKKSIHVRAPFKKEQLLDQIQDDAYKVFDWSWIYYLFTLISGVMIGWYVHIYFLQYKKSIKQSYLTQVKDAKTLLTHLALEGGHEALIEKAQRERWSMKQILNELK